MTIKTCSLWPFLALIAFISFEAQLFRAGAQGTAFTYQGRLNDGANPARGVYDFRFRLASDPLANTYIGAAYLTNAVGVTNGLFTVTPDFGPGILTGSNYWLEVDVRTNGGGAYSILSPLQRLTPTPYAVFASSSSNLLGPIPASQLSGSIPNGNLPSNPSFSGTVTANSFSGNGASVSNVNALSLNGVTSAGFWQLGGNNVGPGQFLGSLNNQPVEIWAGGQRGMRFEPNAGGSPNIIGGYPNNSISGGALGSFIGGGFQNTSQGTQTFIGGGGGNTIQSNSSLSAVVAGSLNVIQTNANNAFIGGGQQNVIAGYAFPSGGFSSSIVGGYANYINNGPWSIIGGGYQNKIEYGTVSVIGGGYFNGNLSASYSVIGGGLQNTNYYSGTATTIGGGAQNTIDFSSEYSVIAGGVSNHISYLTPNGTIGGGLSNFVYGISGTVAGGEYNRASAFRDTVGGGLQNTASGGISTVGGGWTNVASGNAATVSGGSHNVANGLLAVVPGGGLNQASGLLSFAAGSQAQAVHQGSFVWADTQNPPFSSTAIDEFSVRAFNGVRIQTDKGIHLDAADRPMIVRDWDVFASNAPNGKAGLGRWGMFMEPSFLTIGIPELGGRGFQIARYNTNGTPATLVSVDQSGNLFVANNVFAHGVLLTSDRDAKEHFAPVNPKSVLSKVAALPITEWNYKGDENKHVGPVAQDFHAAFGLNGTDDKHISAVDEGGVALAAIQGLNQKLNEKESEIEKLKLTNDSLAERLSALEAAVKAMAR